MTSKAADALATRYRGCLTPQTTCLATWALAELGPTSCSPESIRAILAEASGQLLDMTPLDQSTLLVALAKLKGHVDDGRLVKALVRQVRNRIQRHSAQGVADVLWALAALGVDDSDTCHKAADHLAGSLASYPSLTLSRITQALTALEVYVPSFFAATAQLLRSSPEQLSPDAVANCLGALAMARYVDRPAIHAAVGQLRGSFPTLPPRLVPLLAGSLAKLGVDPGADAVVALAERGSEVASQCPPKSLAWLAWGLTLLMDPVGGSVSAQPAAQSLSEISRGHCALGEIVAEATRKLQAPGSSAPEAGTDEDARAGMASLFHAHVVWEARDALARGVPHTEGAKLIRDAEFLAACKAAFVAERTFTVSLLHQDVQRQCNRRRFVYIPEYRTQDDVCSIDLALKLPGRSDYDVALEVDGNQHFSVTQPYVEVGRTVARNALLRARGWRVVSVPFFEWSELKTMQQQQNYLDRKLKGLQ